MKNKLGYWLLPFLLIFSFHTTLYSQVPGVQWKKTYGGSADDFAISMEPCSDGGYIVAGYTASVDSDITINQGAFDYWIVKLSAGGLLQWQRTFGGSGYDLAQSVQQTTDGGYVVAGYSQSVDGDVTGNHGNNDFWVIKLDSTGLLVWEKTFGGPDDDQAYCVRQTTDFGYVISGWSNSISGDVTANHGQSDCWIVKLNSLGNMQWEQSLGGGNSEGASGIEETSDGGFVVSGSTASSNGDVSVAFGSYDYWIVKLNNSGTLEWQKSYGGTGWDQLQAVRQTMDGGFVLAGFSASTDSNVSVNHGLTDYWIVKTDSVGNIQWEKSFGGAQDDFAYSISLCSDGGFFAVGYSNSTNGDLTNNHGMEDYWMVKLDSAGTLQWQKSMGGSSFDYGFSGKQTPDGGYVIAGTANSSNGGVTINKGGDDFWIIKLNPLPTGIVETKWSQALSVYPNPFTDELNVRLLSSFNMNYGFTEFMVEDLTGRILVKKMEDNTVHDSLGTFKLNLSYLTPGLYILKLKNADHIRQTKFLKQ